MQAAPIPIAKSGTHRADIYAPFRRRLKNIYKKNELEKKNNNNSRGGKMIEKGSIKA